MTRCYVKDCSGAPVGALTHSYAPEGLLWYCADHSPSSDHWRDQTLQAVARSAERMASALEDISRRLEREHKQRYGPWDGELHKVTPEEYAKLNPLERRWAFVS